MNRYVLDGIEADLKQGKHIIAIGRWSHGMEYMHQQLCARLANTDAAIRRASGQQSIELPNGGSIRFYPTAKAVRGRTADVMIIDAAIRNDRHFISSSLPGFRGRPYELIVTD